MSHHQDNSPPTPVDCDGTPESSHLLNLILDDYCPACGTRRNPYPSLPATRPAFPLALVVVCAGVGAGLAVLALLALTGVL